MSKYSIQYRSDVPTGGVRLTGGRLKKSFDDNIAFLKGFDLDRILYWYRVHAGKPAPGVPYVRMQDILKTTSRDRRQASS